MGDEWLRALKGSTLGTRSKDQHVMYLDILQKMANKPLDVVVANPKRMGELMRASMTVSSQRAATAAVRALGKHGGLPPEYGHILTEWGKIHAEASRQDIERARRLQPEQLRVSVADILTKEQQLARETPGSDEHLLVAAGAANLPRFIDLGAVSLGPEVGELVHGEARFVVPPAGGPPSLLVRSAESSGEGLLDLGATPQLCEAVGRSLAARPRKHLFLDSSGSPFSTRKAFLKWAATRLSSVFGGKKVSLLDLHKSFNKDGVQGDAVKRAVVGVSTPSPSLSSDTEAPRRLTALDPKKKKGGGTLLAKGQGTRRGIHVLKDGTLAVVL